MFEEKEITDKNWDPVAKRVKGPLTPQDWTRLEKKGLIKLQRPAPDPHEPANAEAPEEIRSGIAAAEARHALARSTAADAEKEWNEAAAARMKLQRRSAMNFSTVASEEAYREYLEADKRQEEAFRRFKEALEVERDCRVDLNLWGHRLAAWKIQERRRREAEAAGKALPAIDGRQRRFLGFLK